MPHTHSWTATAPCSANQSYRNHQKAFESFHTNQRRSRSERARFRLLANGKTAGSAEKEAERRKKEQGRSTYSPQSYKELLQDAVQSIECALDDGVKRMEVDFPTLSGDSERLSPLTSLHMASVLYTAPQQQMDPQNCPCPWLQSCPTDVPFARTCRLQIGI